MLGSIPLVLFLDNKRIVKIEANTIYRFSNQQRNGLIVIYSIIGLNLLQYLFKNVIFLINWKNIFIFVNNSTYLYFIYGTQNM